MPRSYAYASKSPITNRSSAPVRAPACRQNAPKTAAPISSSSTIRGRYRMAGRGSLAGLLPYGDANAIVVEMAAEVLPIARKTPVLAGVCGTDPFRVMDLFLRGLKQLGFSGVQNFQTVGLI